MNQWHQIGYNLDTDIILSFCYNGIDLMSHAAAAFNHREEDVVSVHKSNDQVNVTVEYITTLCSGRKREKEKPKKTRSKSDDVRKGGKIIIITENIIKQSWYRKKKSWPQQENFNCF